MRTYAADNERHGAPFLDKAEGVQVMTIGKQSKISLDVNIGRACQVARGHAIAVVPGQDQIESVAPRLANPLGIRMNNHALLDLHDARRDQPLPALNLRNTDTAAAKRFQVLLKTESGDLDPGILCCRKDSDSGFD
jgi:hypothetical protein